MSVSNTHPQYDKYVKRWKLVCDVLESDVLKHIKSVDANDIIRNERYKSDAQFTNFTGRTVSGLVGAVFRRDTVLELPPSLQYLKEDATGDELPLGKLAQELVRLDLSYGRYGLLVDFPQLPEGETLTALEVEKGNYKASILKYSPQSIINWHITRIGAKNYLDMVVLKECVEEIDPDDGFQWEKKDQYRVLKLSIDDLGNRIYYQELYDENEELISSFIPKNKAGEALTEIPFVFLGAQDNDSKIDPLPIYDLAKLNLGHLQNSADYEESIHIVGQPTLVFTTDLDADTFAASNPDGVYIGSRRGLNLGSNGNASFLQASPNQLADKAMERKEAQAIMLGARLVVPSADRETAEAARMRHSGETSILSTIVHNVEQALKKSLEICLQFMSDNINKDRDLIIVDINDTFFDPKIDPNYLIAAMQLVDTGLIAKADFRRKLRSLGIIDPDRSDSEIDSEVEALMKTREDTQEVVSSSRTPNNLDEN